MPAIHHTINQYFMKIILLGYMGSGKSTIAKSLTEGQNSTSLDLDDYIVQAENSSISDIFKNQGEIYFRLAESKYLKELINEEKELVLALGGGTPCYADNIQFINKNAISIYLKASINTLFERLKKEKEHRPLITAFADDQLKEYIAKHLFERRPYYEQAQHSINIDNKNVEEIVMEIKDKLA